MTEYSYHMERADAEREVATRAFGTIGQQIHEQLAELHEALARELAEAWRPDSDIDAHEIEARAQDARRRFRLILASF